MSFLYCQKKKWQTATLWVAGCKMTLENSSYFGRLVTGATTDEFYSLPYLFLKGP